MVRVTPKLKDIYEGINQVFSATNLDDIFREIANNDIKEVIVDRHEMFLITMFFVANTVISTEGVGWEKINWLAWRALAEGRVDKFLGVKLILEE